jgi:hypothetical protein
MKSTAHGDEMKITAHLDEMKITTHLDHISLCKTASGMYIGQVRANLALV